MISAGLSWCILLKRAVKNYTQSSHVLYMAPQCFHITLFAASAFHSFSVYFISQALISTSIFTAVSPFKNSDIITTSTSHLDASLSSPNIFLIQLQYKNKQLLLPNISTFTRGSLQYFSFCIMLFLNYFWSSCTSIKIWMFSSLTGSKEKPTEKLMQVSWHQRFLCIE